MPQTFSSMALSLPATGAGRSGTDPEENDRATAALSATYDSRLIFALSSPASVADPLRGDG